MQLRELLEGKSLAELETIAGWYGLKQLTVSGSPKKEFLQKLSDKINTSVAMIFALNRLTLPQRRLLIYLGAAGGQLIDVDLIQEVMAGDRSAFEEAFAGLAAAALVWKDSKELEQFGWQIIGIPEELLVHVPIPFILRGMLTQFLSRLTILKLQEVARHLGISTKMIHHAYLIKKIRQQMLDPVYLRRYIDDLSKEESVIFQFIFDSGGRITTEALDQQFSLAYHYKHGLRRLLDRPILIPDRYSKEGENVIISAIRIPREILGIIRNHYYGAFSLTDLKNIVTELQPAPSAITPSSAIDLERNLVLFLGYILRHHPSPIRRHKMERRHLKKIATYMPPPQIRYIEFLHAISEEIELIKVSSRQWKPGRGCQLFFDDFWQFKLMLTERWLDFFLKEKQPTPSRSDSSSDETFDRIPELRHMVLEVLSDLPPDAWISIAQLRDLTMRRFSACRRILESSDNSGQGKPYRRVLETSFYWLGLVELGALATESAQAPQNDYIRLTEQGRSFIFGWLHDQIPPFLTHYAQSDDSPLLEYANNGVIRVPQNYSRYLLLNLLSFTNIEKAYPEIELTITRDSIRNGFDTGLSSDAMRNLLSVDSRQQTPQSILDLLADCVESYGNVVIGGGGGYIKAEDSKLLKHITHEKKYQKFIYTKLTDRCAILNPHINRDRLLDILRRDGLMPVVKDERVRRRSGAGIRIVLNSSQLIFLEKVLYIMRSLCSRHHQKDLDILFEELHTKVKRNINQANQDQATALSKELFERFIKILQTRPENP